MANTPWMIRALDPIWRDDRDYYVGDITVGSDSRVYVCKQDTGPYSGVGSHNPANGEASEYWAHIGSLLVEEGAGLIVNETTGETSVDVEWLGEQVAEMAPQVEVAEDDKILAIEGDTLSSGLTVTYDENTGVFNLVGKDGSSVVASVKIPAATSLLRSVELVTEYTEGEGNGPWLRFTFALSSGETAYQYVDVSELVDTYTAGAGLTLEGNEFAVDGDWLTNQIADASASAAVTAERLATARNINGTAFDGTQDITTAQWGTARNISVSDADETNTGVATSVNGSGAVTLKLPATIKGALTGNADTATKLATARTVHTNLASSAAASFDGSGNITPGVTGILPVANGGTGNANGVATSASKLTEACDINGTEFDGTRDITTSLWGAARNISVSDASGSYTGDAVSVDGSAAATLKLPATIKGALEGNADTATKLATARTIRTNLASSSTASFDGTGNITPGVTGILPVANGGTGNATGTAASSDKLTTARSINGTAFDGTQNITTAQWGTARNISISDAEGENTGAATSVNGSGAVTLKLPATIKGDLEGNADTASKLASEQSIQLIGDVVGSAPFDGSYWAEIETALADSGVTAGSYGPSANVAPNHSESFTVPRITVDGKGRVTSAANRTITLPQSVTVSAGDPLLSINGNTLASDLSVRYDEITGIFSVIGKDGSTVVASVKIPAATSILTAVELTSDYAEGTGDGPWLHFVFALSSGETESLYVDVSRLVDIYTAGDGLVLEGNEFAVDSSWLEDRIADASASAAVTAEKLATARNINGTAFDGTQDITTSQWGTARNVSISDSDGTNTGAATSVDGSAAVTLKLPATIKGTLDGTASKATQLATAHTIRTNLATTSYAYFDGTSNVTPGVVGVLSVLNGGTGNRTGEAISAGKLAEAQNITLAGDVAGSAQFDGSSEARINTTLANTGVTAGSYGPSNDAELSNNGAIAVPQLTVDAKGRVTAATDILFEAGDGIQITENKVSVDADWLDEQLSNLEVEDQGEGINTAFGNPRAEQFTSSEGVVTSDNGTIKLKLPTHIHASIMPYPYQTGVHYNTGSIVIDEEQSLYYCIREHEGSANNGPGNTEYWIPVTYRAGSGLSVSEDWTTISVDADWLKEQAPDLFEAGDGIQIVDNTVSIKVRATSSGLGFEDSAMYVDFSNMPADLLQNIVYGMVQEGGGLSVDGHGQLYVDFNEIDPSILRSIVYAMCQEGGGLSVDESGQLYVDFNSMPTDKFEELLKSIRVPIWLTANKTFYVNCETGSDDTTIEGIGETSGNPFKTIQACVNYVTDNYNISRYTCTISVAAGTYEEQVTLGSYTVSTGSICLLGAGKGRTVIKGSLVNGTLLLVDGGEWYVSGITLDVTQVSGDGSLTQTIVYCIQIASGATLRIGCFSINYAQEENLTVYGSPSYTYIIIAAGSFIFPYRRSVSYAEHSEITVSTIDGTPITPSLFTTSTGGSYSFGTTNDSNFEDTGNIYISGKLNRTYYSQGGTGTVVNSRAYDTKLIERDTVTNTSYKVVLINGATFTSSGEGEGFFPGDGGFSIEESTYSWYK